MGGLMGIAADLQYTPSSKRLKEQQLEQPGQSDRVLSNKVLENW